MYEPVKHPGKDVDDPVVETVIGSPTENPCSPRVVTVATFEVIEPEVIDTRLDPGVITSKYAHLS